MKKILTLLMVVATIGFVFAGCAPAEGGDAGAKTKTPAAEKTE